MSGRGVRWCGGGEGSGRRFVVVVGFDVVAFEVVAVGGNEGVKNAANNLWDGRRSYGGPKGEGRLIMQRGENGKRGSEGKRLGVNRAGERRRERKRGGKIGEGGKSGEGPIRIMFPPWGAHHLGGGGSR